MKNKSNLGRLALLSAALIWGTSFIVMKSAVDAIPVFLLLAVRITIATVLVGLIFIKRMRQMTRSMVVHGCIIGA